MATMATTVGKRLGLAAAMATRWCLEETKASIDTPMVRGSHRDGWGDRRMMGAVAQRQPEAEKKV